MSSTETSETKFYYWIRHPDGRVVGSHVSCEKYGKNSMLGAYKLEPTTKAELETLEMFGSVSLTDGDDSVDLDSTEERYSYFPCD